MEDEGSVGPLVMADANGYIGKVGGFSEESLERITENFTLTEDRRVSSGEVGEANTAVEPFVFQVRYQGD